VLETAPGPSGSVAMSFCDVGADHSVTSNEAGPVMELVEAALYADFLGSPTFLWIIFATIVVGLLVLDLGVLHRSQKEIGAKESLLLYTGYMAIAVVFGAWVWWTKGSQSGLEFFTGYLIEQSLSMDNIFVIATIFGSLAIPRIYQHRVLFWGILGVVLFRAILIGAGAALIMAFSWSLYVFGAFLILSGIRMFAKREHASGLEDNLVLAWMRRHFRITDQFHSEKFIVKLPSAVSGKPQIYVTPLLLALVTIEMADLIFAVDSVPAVFAVTQDPFIVYTSNIFAILGLRSLYFALAAAVHRFRYLQAALAVVLMLVGVKIFLVPIGVKIPALLSLAVTAGVLAAGVIYSLWRTQGELAATTK
jgi:tellurite resistance protein TerC